MSERLALDMAFAAIWLQTLNLQQGDSRHGICSNMASDTEFAAMWRSMTQSLVTQDDVSECLASDIEFAAMWLQTWT